MEREIRRGREGEERQGGEGEKERERDRERRRGREVRSAGDAGPAHGRGTGTRSAWETSKKLEGGNLKDLKD